MQIPPFLESEPEPYEPSCSLGGRKKEKHTKEAMLEEDHNF